MTKAFFKAFLLVGIVSFFSSCDKEYDSIGANIIGDNHFNTEKYDGASLSIINQKTGPIQTSNLDIYPFGIIENEVFGNTTANFATQVQLASVAPEIIPAKNQVIESVVLHIPYYSKLVSTNTDGTHTYTLDSIVKGNYKTAKMKLSVYENNYFMRDRDPLSNFTEDQRFYSDQDASFNFLKGNTLYENNSFQFSDSEYKIISKSSDGTESTSYLAPGLHAELDKNYFNSKIFLASSDKLQNNTAFCDWFKGLYFRIEGVQGESKCMAMMNFRKGTITVNYYENTISTDPTKVYKTIVMNLTGNSVGLLNNDYSTNGSTYASLPATTTDNSRIYLKGGEGSIGVIKLFGTTDLKGYSTSTGLFTNAPNGVPDELDDLRSKNWLINEANISFYIDQTIMNSNVVEPNRLFLYDINNKSTLDDYKNDYTTGYYPNTSKYQYGGIIDKGTSAIATSRGIRYKVRITDYLRKLLKNSDSTNVKLGIAVCQSINTISFGKQKSAPAVNDDNWKSLLQYEKNAYFYPLSSVMNPLGTVIYGNTPDVPDDKKLKLEIYFTKPK